MSYQINMYDSDTDIWIATIRLNNDLSRRIRESITDWDDVGEYSLDDLINSQMFYLSFIQLNPSNFLYTLELS